MDADLHTHTRHSDGTTSPTENVRLARAQGLAALAITDHDTLTGWDEAADAARRTGLVLVPGVELSAERDGDSVHLLGYWVDPDHEGLAAECVRLRDHREDRVRRMLERLAELDAAVTFEAVRRVAGTAPLGRPHVAQALVEAGHVADFQQAFDELLADGRPAAVPKHALSPEDAVRLIVDAGGAAVLAHPALSSPGVIDEALLDRLVVAGLVGVEADHADQDRSARERWRRLAAERDLLVTGGSDFHGDRKRLRVGQGVTPVARVERLAERAADPQPAIDATAG